jgi:arsenate reductase
MFTPLLVKRAGAVLKNEGRAPAPPICYNSQPVIQNTGDLTMADLTIYHNPRCSKSRQTLALLEENGATPEIVLYLESPPTEAGLQGLLAKLGLGPRELMRKGEDVYREKGLADESLSDTELIAAMVAHPILIERPVVVKGDRAVLGRPPENVLDLLG